ncbi:PREDICTED: centromere protein S [Charadrius vociferus]|uniref:centromere protein S n=1 Tax=Charadrius vociferus TaxID=50402 RepID=UPI0005215BA1|nr:PREDICTED: centromere protein S [Charadrius vociferus]
MAGRACAGISLEPGWGWGHEPASLDAVCAGPDAPLSPGSGPGSRSGWVGDNRLKAAVHYTVGCLCQEVAEDKDVQFSKQTIAAISEITFRQCDNFAKDLEMFARHAKRSTVTTEDVKLLARRSNSLLKYITQKSEEITSNNMEQKEKKKKKSSAAKGGRAAGEQEAAVTESEDSNMT